MPRNAATWSILVIDPAGANPPGVVVANVPWDGLRGWEEEAREKYPDRVILTIQEKNANVYQHAGANLKGMKLGKIVNNSRQ